MAAPCLLTWRTEPSCCSTTGAVELSLRVPELWGVHHTRHQQASQPAVSKCMNGWIRSLHMLHTSVAASSCCRTSICSGLQPRQYCQSDSQTPRHVRHLTVGSPCSSLCPSLCLLGGLWTDTRISLTSSGREGLLQRMSLADRSLSCRLLLLSCLCCLQVVSGGLLGVGTINPATRGIVAMPSI